MAAAILQSHPLQSPFGQLPRLRATRQFQGQQHVFQRGEPREKLKRLKNEPDPPGAQGCTAILVEGIEIAPLEEYAAAGGQIEPGKKAQQRRLAGSGGTDDGHRFAALDDEIDLIQYGQPTAGGRDLAAQIFRLQNG
ncbi:MAG: hypothetical protein Kow006_07800 [Gammaproteobacteria bacterium]